VEALWDLGATAEDTRRPCIRAMPARLAPPDSPALLCLLCLLYLLYLLYLQRVFVEGTLTGRTGLRPAVRITRV
jgi:hypothetical protein